MLDYATKAQIYRAMADRIQQGWTKKTMQDGYGNVCLRGAAQEVCDVEYVISDEMGRELKNNHGWIRLLGDATPAMDVELWNDAPWRRKRDVLKFVTKLAEKYEKLAEQERVSKLDAQVKFLQAENADLRARIAELEARVNSLQETVWFLRGVKDARLAKQLRDANSELAMLDEELDAKLAELQTVRS